ncbi:MAG TPA: ornithine cyclodeaminase family protein [Planctomycetota bacterium]
MTETSGSTPVLLLPRSAIPALLTLDECREAVERAFRLLGEGKVPPPETLGVHVEEGGFHVKAGAAILEQPWFVAKINANFPANPARSGLPTIQGLAVLFDAGDGRPLAVLDSSELTCVRTAAATAVAAKVLARPAAEVATIVGCGRQAAAQLRALLRVLPLRRVQALDALPGRAEAFARAMAAELGIEVSPGRDLAAALAQSDVLVTCTPARAAFVRKRDVRPGTFVAAVGADSEGKHEIEEELMASASVFVDLLPQAARIGDLQHALARGTMTREDVRAELGAVVAGRAPGRVAPDEITIFDSTGIALQDLVTAVALVEGARRAGEGVARFDFSA